MDKVREIQNENYMGFIIEDENMLLSNVLPIIEKGTTPGIIKGYLLKQNGKEKVIYNVNSFRNFYSDIRIMDEESFIRVLLSIPEVFHHIAVDTVFPLECISLDFRHFFYDPAERKIMTLAIPATTGLDPNKRRICENNIKYMMQRYISDSIFVNSQRCLAIYKDLADENNSLEDLYRNILAGKYGAGISKERDYSALRPVFKLVPSNVANPVFLINKEKLIVGRSTASETEELLVLNVQGISREHSEIVFQNGQLFIKDLVSTNGTFVNDIKIFSDQYIPLKAGDRVRFSNVEYEVQFITYE